MHGHTCLLQRVQLKRSRHDMKVPRTCRVLRSFEPAFAGGPRLRNAALAQAYRVISVRLKPDLIGVGSKPRVQHHEHGRARFLYHNRMSMGREKLTVPALLLYKIYVKLNLL